MTNAASTVSQILRARRMPPGIRAVTSTKDRSGEPWQGEAPMNIGEQRRTIYIEPIEDPESLPMKEPSPGVEPLPVEPDLSPETEPATPA